MVNENHVPERINSFNVYLDGTDRLIGVMPELDLPGLKMKTSTTSGAGLLGDIDDPTVGQFESMEMELKFNLLYSGFEKMLAVNRGVNLTIRAAQQVLSKDLGYEFKGLVCRVKGVVKEFNHGKLKPGEGMEASVKLELTRLYLESDGEVIQDVDKLNGVWNSVDGDQMAAINALI